MYKTEKQAEQKVRTVVKEGQHSVFKTKVLKIHAQV